MEIPATVLVWQFDGKPTLNAIKDYKHNEGYNLYCTTNKKYLSWRKNHLGINLEYIDDAKEKKVHLHFKNGTTGPVLTGQLFAFGLGGKPSFINYSHRTWGINLEYQDNPSYEWMIFSKTGKKNEQVNTKEPYALININVKPDPDFLIFLEREVPRVCDIGWTTSPNKLGKIVHLAKDINDFRKEII